jgi:hypothetical protein
MLAAAFSLVVAQPSVAHANEPVVNRSVAVWQLDALGIDGEIALRLESLFRTEIERMTGRPVPSRREIGRILDRRLAQCSGATDCLVAIGAKLGVELIISGNVAALADSYVVNLKAIDVAAGTELRKIQSDPLRGTPDELIEAVRVAAYRLLAPERLRGQVAVLTDLVGARVYLDGELVGTTPLAGPIDGATLGAHKLRVAAPGYTAFEEPVEVRFQKTSRVLVRLALADPGAGVPLGPGADPAPSRRRWYESTWVAVAAGITAAVLGGYVGYRLARDPVTDCAASPEACR